MTEENKIPDELDVLLDNPIEIAGYKIKGWTIPQIAALSPAMRRIYMRMQEDDITLKDVRKDVPKLIFAVLPEATEILRVTLGIPDEEILKIGQEHLLVILTGIVNANHPYLKNWVSLVLQTIRAAKVD